MHPLWPLIRLAVLALVILGPGYVIACWIWPFAACRKCAGAGKFKTSSGRAWRKCRRCKGSGERLRLGRKMWNRYRRST